jgi:hypothetical protein
MITALTKPGQHGTASTRGYPVNINQQARSTGRLPALLIFASIVLMACSSSLQVRSDIDPMADFNQYNSFNFFDPMGIEGGNNSPIFGEHYRAALSRELGQRGYRPADNPDLLINVTMRADDKVSMRSYTSPYMTGGYYGRPGGPYAGSALGVGVSVGPRVTESTEVSVFIDFVDFEEHRVVWQGVTVVKVSDKVSQQLRDAIYTSVNRVLAEYPHTAGR